MARSLVLNLSVCVLLLGAGCSSLRLPLALHTGELDTPTFARSALRVNALPVTVTPPLTLVWQYDISAATGPGSPLLVDSIVFVGNLRGELYALNLRTGKRIGWVSLGASIEGTPAIERDLAIVPLAGSHESLVAFDLVQGTVRWRASLGDIHTSPLVMDARVFVGNTQGTLFAVDKLTGVVLWRFELPRNIALKGIRSSPAGWLQHVVFGADDGAVYDLDPGTGILHWRYEVDGAIQAAPSIADSTAFVGTLRGTVYAIRLADGSLRWRRDAGSSVYAPPLIHSGLCIFGTTGGTVFALDQRTGAIAWSCDIHAPINSGVLAVNNALYVGTLRKELIAIDPANGTILWRETLSGRVKTAPIAGGNRVIVATDDRLIQAFGGSE